MPNQYAYRKNNLSNDDTRELDFPQVKKRVAHWISKKDYSELELREKLSRYTSEDIIDRAIAWCHQLKLIPPPEVMTENIIVRLNREKKGIQQINHTLTEKGLAAIAEDRDAELEKAIELVGKKMLHSMKSQTWKELGFQDKQKTKAKAFRFLATRGFTSEIIQSSFEKWLQNNKDTDVYENE